MTNGSYHDQGSGVSGFRGEEAVTYAGQADGDDDWTEIWDDSGNTVTQSQSSSYDYQESGTRLFSEQQSTNWTLNDLVPSAAVGWRAAVIVKGDTIKSDARVQYNNAGRKGVTTH